MYIHLGGNHHRQLLQLQAQASRSPQLSRRPQKRNCRKRCDASTCSSLPPSCPSFHPRLRPPSTCSSLPSPSRPSLHPRLRPLQVQNGSNVVDASLGRRRTRRQGCRTSRDVRVSSSRLLRSRSPRRQGCRTSREVGVSSHCHSASQGCAQVATCLVLNAFAEAIGDVPSVDSTTTRPSRFARTTGAGLRRVL